MRLGRTIGVALLWGVAATRAPVRAADAWGRLLLLNQVRDNYQTYQTQAPIDFYANLGVSNMSRASQAETYFRLAYDDNGPGDFYAGYAQVPNALPGVEATAGRQFLSEGPGGVFVADAGKVRIDRGWPVAFTIYGGRPEYFEPTYSTPIISQDEWLFGGNVRTTRWRGGQLTLGYQQWERQGHVLHQLISGSAVQSLSTLPGLPQFYAALAYDADHQNIDTANAGVDLFFARVNVLVNLAGTYYQPQDQGAFVTDVDWREDSIFQLYSDSGLVQVRGGLRHPFSRELSAYADFSYQRYENAVRARQNGYLSHAGLLWLPEGDGLERVLLTYYMADSGGGNVNGVSLSYRNSVYEQIVFEFQADLAYYEKESNQSDWPVHTRTGIGYEFVSGLTGEVYVEANRNVLFDADLRFGLTLSYNFRRPLPTLAAVQERL